MIALLRRAQRSVHGYFSVVSRVLYEHGSGYSTVTGMLSSFFAVSLVIDYFGLKRCAFTPYSIPVILTGTLAYTAWVWWQGKDLAPWAGLVMVAANGTIAAIIVGTQTDLTKVIVNLQEMPLIAMYVAWFYRPVFTRCIIGVYMWVIILSGYFGSGTYLQGPSVWHEILRLALFTMLSAELGILWRKRIQVDNQIDVLTKAINRAGMYPRVAKEIVRARRYSQPLCVVMIDVDDFKQVNDMKGHFVGDMLLASLVDQFRASMRKSDSIFRLGGDEFMLLLPGTNAAGAETIVNRLQGETYHPWSCGVAELRPEDDVETLLSCADQRMYDDKYRRKLKAGLISE